MTPQFKQEVVTALRDGSYIQTRQCLCENKGDDEFGYCCLGVIAELGGARRVQSPKAVLVELAYGDGDEYQANTDFIPSRLALLLGIEHDGSFERTPEIDKWFHNNAP